MSLAESISIGNESSTRIDEHDDVLLELLELDEELELLDETELELD